MQRWQRMPAGKLGTQRRAEPCFGVLRHWQCSRPCPVAHTSTASALHPAGIAPRLQQSASTASLWLDRL